MAHGIFFKLDENASLSDKIIVYRYLDIINEDGTSDFDTYPVYMTISQYSIDFYSVMDSYPESSKNTLPGHLLHLPVSKNIHSKDNLYEKLNSIFPDLKNLPANKYIYRPDKDRSDSYRKECKTNSYGEGYKKLFPHKNSADKENLSFPLRDLFLDFLFDLEHSDLFKNSPGYEIIIENLENSQFISSILNKSRYYFNRKIYKEKNERQDSTASLNLQNLLHSEKRWLKTIRDPKSIDFFSSSKWFSSVEEEYKNVLFANDIDRNKLYKKGPATCISETEFNNKKQEKGGDKNNFEILTDSMIWFLKRYSMCQAYKVLYSVFPALCNHITVLYLSVVVIEFILIIFILPHGLSGVEVFVLLLCAVPVITKAFLCLRLLLYSFTGFAVSISSLLLPRLIMAIFSSWLIFSYNDDIFKISLSASFVIDIEFLFMLSLFFVMFVFISIELKKLAPDITLAQTIPRILVVLLYGTSISILIGLLITQITAEPMITGGGYLKSFYKDEIYSLSNGEYKLNNPYKINATNTLQLNESHPQSAFETKIDNACAEVLFTNLESIEFDCLLSHRILVTFWNKKFIFMPALIFFRATLALFVGICIQLIFEEKAITEPI